MILFFVQPYKGIPKESPSQAPLYSGDHGVPTHIHEAAVDWSRHHRQCSHCQRYDWFNPGSPAFGVDPFYADGTLDVIRDGKKTKVTYARRADPSVLCEEGEELFSIWVGATLGYRPVRRSHNA